MLRVLPLMTAFASVLGFGVLHGLWTDRWKLSNEPERSAARVQDVSLTLGEWEGRSEGLDERTLTVAEIVGYINRQYVNRRTGDTIGVLLVCVRPGPIAVHTPDVCFRGLGYDFSSAPDRYRLETEGVPVAEFNRAKMHKMNVAGAPPLRVYWTWSAMGTWNAPTHPRLSFARYPALYKLYVLRQMPRADEPDADDPCLGFLKLLLPELQRALFGPA
jgi:hypothetical protein